MQRSSQFTFITMACLCVGMLASRATAQSDRPQSKPTAYSVLSLATEIVENAKTASSRAREETRNEAIRLPLRYRIALSIRKTGLETAFGDYVATALGAWEVWDPQRALSKPEALRHAEEIQAEAKHSFLAGDPETARRLLLGPDCKGLSLLIYSCILPDAVDTQFLQWEIEGGNLTAAARRLKETDWKSKKLQVFIAERLVRALFDAHRTNEGRAILADLRSNPGLDQVLMAQALWRLGQIDEGETLLRESAKAALEEASRNPRYDPPIATAGLQLAMGDKVGGADTLHRIKQLGAARFDTMRAPLAGRLAFAALDADAFSLLDTTLADRPVLADIVMGQARRGDFTTAFSTLYRLRALPVDPKAGNFRNPGARTAAAAIERYAARAGDTDAFSRADAIRRDLDPGPHFITTIAAQGNLTHLLQDDFDAQWLADFARVGKAEFAIDYALALPDLPEKIDALDLIAEVLAGVTHTGYDPLVFGDGW